MATTDTSSVWDGITINFDDLMGGGGYDWYNRFIPVGGSSYRLLHGYMVAGLRDMNSSRSTVVSLAGQVTTDAAQVALDKAAATTAATTAVNKAGEAAESADAAQQAANAAATVTVGKADGDLSNVSNADFQAKATAAGVGVAATPLLTLSRAALGV